MRIKLLLPNTLALWGFFYVYGPFYFPFMLQFHLSILILSLYSGRIIHKKSNYVCSASDRGSKRAPVIMPVIPSGRIWPRELKCEVRDPNLPFPLIVSNPGYFSECKHINLLSIIPVLKNSGPTTQAYYLSWQTTEELALTSVQTPDNKVTTWPENWQGSCQYGHDFIGIFQGGFYLCALALLTLVSNSHVSYDYTVLIREAGEIT